MERNMFDKIFITDEINKTKKLNKHKLKQTFGDRLRKLRKTKNLTQEDFIKELNLDVKRRETITNWESSSNTGEIPDIYTLIKICNFFSCDMEYLFGEIEEQTKDVADIAEFTGLNEASINDLHYLSNIKRIYVQSTVNEEYMDWVNKIKKKGNPRVLDSFENIEIENNLYFNPDNITEDIRQLVFENIEIDFINCIISYIFSMSEELLKCTWREWCKRICTYDEHYNDIIKPILSKKSMYRMQELEAILYILPYNEDADERERDLTEKRLKEYIESFDDEKDGYIKYNLSRNIVDIIERFAKGQVDKYIEKYNFKAKHSNEKNNF